METNVPFLKEDCDRQSGTQGKDLPAGMLVTVISAIIITTFKVSEDWFVKPNSVLFLYHLSISIIYIINITIKESS